LFVKDAIIDQGKVKDVDFGQAKAAGELFQKVKKDGPPPVLSLHTEKIDHANPALLPKRIEAIGRDIATLTSWLGETSNRSLTMTVPVEATFGWVTRCFLRYETGGGPA